MKTTQAKPRATFSSPLSPDELGLARQSSSIFDRHIDMRGRLTFHISEGKKQETIVIPAAAARLFKDILLQMSEGNEVTIMPRQVELTTQQAADLLNVSRPFLIGLLDGGKIPCRKVGTHRRISAKDVLSYKRAIEAASNRALDELAKQAQELNMGY
jgi:excisionase family DNA binding protein